MICAAGSRHYYVIQGLIVVLLLVMFRKNIREAGMKVMFTVRGRLKRR